MAHLCGKFQESLSFLNEAVRHAGFKLRGLSPSGYRYESALPCHLAEPLLLLGQVGESWRMSEEGLRRARDSSALVQRGFAAETLRLKGEVLLMCRGAARDEAEHCFRAALEIARAQQAKWWELRSSVSLARLLCDTDRRDEARTMLANLYNWFTEGFELPDLKEAKTLLDELSE
jgi:predicted ATPase